MSLSVHNVERLMELRAQLVEQEHRPTKHTYTPMFAESCATCAFKPSDNCSRACKHHPWRAA